MRFHAAPSLRSELRDLLEVSGQPLNLYGALLRRYNALDREEARARLIDPVTDGLRHSLQGILPCMEKLYLDLPSRAALCHLLSETTQEEESSLELALLEHIALQLEPYLKAAELDPDQASYLQPLLHAQKLETRPVDALMAARRIERRTDLSEVVAPSAPPRRLADGR